MHSQKKQYLEEAKLQEANVRKKYIQAAQKGKTIEPSLEAQQIKVENKQTVQIVNEKSLIQCKPQSPQIQVTQVDSKIKKQLDNETKVNQQKNACLLNLKRVKPSLNQNGETKQLTTVTISLASPSPLQLKQNIEPLNPVLSSIKKDNEHHSLSAFKNGATVKNPQIDAQSVLEKWRVQHWERNANGKDIDSYLALKSVQFKKFRYSIFILQRAALKIQHWFFRLRASQQKYQQLKEAVQWSTTTSQQSYHTRVNKEEMPLTIQEKERENLRKLVAQRISPGMLGTSPNIQLERKLHLQNSGSRNRQITTLPNENKEISHFDVNDVLSDPNEKQQRSSADLTSSNTKRNFFKNDLGSISSIRLEEPPAFTDSSQTPAHSQIGQDRSSIYSKLLRSSKSTANIERVNHIAQGYEEQSYYKIANLNEQQNELHNINTKATTEISKVSIDSKTQQSQKQISISVKIPTETQSLIRKIRPSKDISQALNVREGENRALQVFESYSREREYMSRRSRHGSKDAPCLRESSSLLLVQNSESCLLPASIILEEKFESQPQNSSEAEEEKQQQDSAKHKERSKVEAESILMKMRKRKEVSQVISNLKSTITKIESRNSSVDQNQQRISPSRNLIQNRIEDMKQSCAQKIDQLFNNDGTQLSSQNLKQQSPTLKNNNDDLQIHISRLQSPENTTQSPPQNMSNQVLQSFIDKQLPSRNVQHMQSNTLTLTSQGDSFNNLNLQSKDNTQNKQQIKTRSTSHNQRRVSLLQPLSQQLMSSNLLQNGNNSRINQRYQQQVKRHQSLSMRDQRTQDQQTEKRMNDLAHIITNQTPQQIIQPAYLVPQKEASFEQQRSNDKVKQILLQNQQTQVLAQEYEVKESQNDENVQHDKIEQNNPILYYNEYHNMNQQQQHGLVLDEPTEFLSPGIKFDVSPIQVLKQEKAQTEETNLVAQQSHQNNEERTPSPINLSRYPQIQNEAAPIFKNVIDQGNNKDDLKGKRRRSEIKTIQSKQASVMQQSLTDYMKSKLARKSQIQESLVAGSGILSRNLNQYSNVKNVSMESQPIVQSRNEQLTSKLIQEHKTQNSVLSRHQDQDMWQMKNQLTKNEDYRISPSPPPPLKPSSNNALTRNTINTDQQKESIYQQRFSMSLKNNRPSLLEEPRERVPNPESQPHLSVMHTLQTQNSNSNTPEREVQTTNISQLKGANDGKQTQKVQFAENTQRRSSIYNMLEQNKFNGKLQELKSSVLQKPKAKEAIKHLNTNVKNNSSVQVNAAKSPIKPRFSQAVQSQPLFKQAQPLTYRESVMQPIIYQACSSSSASISGTVTQMQSTTSLNSRQERNKEPMKQASTYEEYKVLQQKQVQKTQQITSTVKSKERSLEKRSSVAQIAHLKQQRSYDRVLNNISKFSQSVLASKHGQQTTQSNAHSHLSISDQISLPSSHQSSSLATY